MVKSKKPKYKPRKQSAKSDTGKPAPNGQKNAVKTDGKLGQFLKLRRVLMVVSALIILAATGFFVTEYVFSPRQSVALPPLPDFQGVEPQVAEDIREKHARIKRIPESAQAWGMLAMSMDIHGFKSPAVPCYQQAAKLDQMDFRWPYLCAIALLESNTLEAGEWFERSQRLQPGYEPTYLRYAEALFNMGNPDKSEKNYQQALDVNPRSSHAYLGLAKIAYSRSEFQKSLQFLQNAVKNDPQHGEVHRFLGDVYRRLNEPQKAENQALLAQQYQNEKPILDPVYEELLNQGVSVAYYQDRGRTLMQRGFYEQAAREFKMALELRPDDLQYNNMGIVLEKLGKLEEAVSHYQKAAAMDSLNWNTYQNLGTVYFRMGQDQQALIYLKKALEINSTSVHAYGMLSYVYKRMGNTGEAFATLRQGLKQVPGDFGLAVRLAWLMATSQEAKFRDGAEAVRLTKNVCEETQYQFAGIVDVLAAAYAENGQFKKAVETAQRAYRLAIANGQKATAEQIQARLKIYQSNNPYHE